MSYLIASWQYIQHCYQARNLIFTLIISDFKRQYLGSYLGLAWAFIQPLVFMLVIWMIFDLGFRLGPSSNDAPFFLWLLAGMVPWFFFSDALRLGTESVVSYAYLVKKVAFKVSLLPLVKIGSSLLIHLGLLLFLLCLSALNGVEPTRYWLQIPYYMAMQVILLIGLTWLTSALRVFVKDVGNFIAMLLQVGFWFTPIFWSLDMIPQSYQYLINFNPVFYIVDGYRDALFGEQWFWDKREAGFYYFVPMLLLLFLGGMVFKRLRPHFSDVI